MTLDENGAFSVALIATDNANMQPTGWAYEVTERFQHAPGRSYSIQLPSTTPVIDLADIAPADPAQGDYVLVQGPAGTPGSKVLSGTGTPSAGTGVNGDYYFDVTPGAVKLHGPKASGAWPAGVLISSAVASVAGRTGAVTLSVADVSGAAPVANIRAITTATVTAASADLLLCDATSNAITVTLPSPTAGATVIVKKTDATANAITLSATVEGVANPTLTVQYQSVHLVGTGSAWVRVTRPSLSAIVDYPTATDLRYLALAGGTLTGALTSTRAASTDTVLTAGVSSDGFDRARMMASGRYEVGSGSAARDTAWYRQGAAMWGTDADVAIRTAGKGLQVKEGTNAKSGTVTLVAGTATVSNTSVTATSRIQLTSQADGGTPGWLRVSARTAGTSFTITSSSASDTSTVAYFIVEPAA
ncbi:hypothetical protein [Streptomyces sp. NPDC005907]|uniref:hypothetical protein n=1 Tax=Streptomyces sp. NPDC005907 TaxID=3154571 RepID=UPI0033D2882E